MKPISHFWQSGKRLLRLKYIVQDCRYMCSSCRSNEEKTHKIVKSPYMITTPIFYVNAAPHMGHLFCALMADATARWQRLKGKNTLFTTGTDEHGLKIQQSAALRGVEPRKFCDGVAGQFQKMFDEAQITYDKFIRTTDEKHTDAVHAFWTRLSSSGNIYKGTYAGWYSVSDEAFLIEEDIEEKIDSKGLTKLVSKDSGHPVVWTEENNYMFRLSHFKADLLHWLKKAEIHPPEYKSVINRMIQNLPDLSVSRDRSRLPWGIPVPGDSSQTIYVWLDALINYLTATGYPHTQCHTTWPPHCQVIGKDILRFHAVYWPAFLIAAGMDPPPRLVVHSHWLVDGVKMSKSLGNVIDPMEKMASFGIDGFRYFLLNEGSLSSDGAYSDKRAVERINTDLANTLGNLLGRCTAPSVNKQQELPPLRPDDLYEFFNDSEREKYTLLHQLPDEVDRLYEQFHFTKALDKICQHLRWANSTVQSHEPWKLSKSDDLRDIAHLQLVLHVAMETLRVCGILLQPVVPHLSDRLLSRLGVPHNERMFQNAQEQVTQGYGRLGGKVILQKRVHL